MIDKQALREAAEKALPAMKRLLMMPNDELFDEALLNVDGDVDAANAFNLLTGPETVLALLDELEAAEKRIAELEAAEKRIAELEATAFSKAAIDVLAERQRQQSAEGWTTEHDDDHSCGEMALAASSYAQYAHRKPIAPAIPFNWPWEPEWFKQQGPRRDLVKAGALILAEIERIDRAAAGKGE
ncbi:ead/Ea22-like family protein [Enterobacter hormaechei]|uniref:ead/Ea22-like family protein n=1 Tax=Enterobacter hormaechei TaxID=158836 RepID=UPI0020234C7C|nr:ead/Ea22-like family protein [Enterobacter hormaechei]MCL8356357.1 ead/Ea22-like family protein [Enterobacter hormaechei subsp. xiangfangensis]